MEFYFKVLPNEILLIIFQYLDILDLLKLRQVSISKRLNNIIEYSVGFSFTNHLNIVLLQDNEQYNDYMEFINWMLQRHEYCVFADFHQRNTQQVCLSRREHDIGFQVNMKGFPNENFKFAGLVFKTPRNILLGINLSTCTNVYRLLMPIHPTSRIYQALCCFELRKCRKNILARHYNIRKYICTSCYFRDRYEIYKIGNCFLKKSQNLIKDMPKCYNKKYCSGIWSENYGCRMQDLIYCEEPNYGYYDDTLFDFDNMIM